MITDNEKRNLVLTAFGQMGANDQDLAHEELLCENMAYVLDWYDTIERKHKLLEYLDKNIEIKSRDFFI